MRRQVSVSGDTQDRLPSVSLVLDRVGIEGLKVPVTLRRNGSKREVMATVDVKIQLDEKHRGVHMSRLVEAVYDAIGHDDCRSFEELSQRILRRLNGSHPFTRGEVNIENSLVMQKKTPSTGRTSFENFEVSTMVLQNQKSVKKLLTVKVVGNTLCPHSLEVSHGRAHTQRAEIQLELLTDFDADVSHEDLIAIGEQSFSAPTYSLLKTADEVSLIDKMYSNPKFVEDVARDCYHLLKGKGLHGETRIRVRSYESIHKHTAVCEIEKEL